jgi:hypothetical protein
MINDGDGLTGSDVLQLYVFPFPVGVYDFFFYV